MTSLLWLKRDLRAWDHAALADAAARSPVVPVYVAEPEYWALEDTSGRQWAFIAESLAELRDDLGRLGAPLVVRVGDAVRILSDLAGETGARALISHEETGNLWTYDRDLRVAAWAREAGIEWVEHRQSAVIRRLGNRDGWAKKREAFVTDAVAERPASIEGVPGLDPGRIPTAAELGMDPDPCPERQRGGRSHGLACLHSFLTVRGRHYRAEMSSPVTGERACSRLSPHLAVGTLSIRETSQANAKRREEVKGREADWSKSLQSFESRLAWRDHFTQKLEVDPEIERQAMHRALDEMRPRDPDRVRLAAWERGEMGLPFADACMRYARATGWLNFRMRSMLQAVASYHLWLDWRATSPILARLWTDYEPGIHWPQSQMQSGTTGMNAVRIYNPVKQGSDQDPTGVFTRRWVPELAAVPDRYLQEPWKWDGLGNAYPRPIVEVKSAATEAKNRVYSFRRGPAFREQAQEVAKRHGSRKPREARRRAS